MPTYSFDDVSASLIAPTGQNFQLAYGSAAAAEGITIEMANDVNTPMDGADGSVLNSKKSTTRAMVTVRLLKTSPVNAQLSLLYNVQTAPGAGALGGHGSNVITVSNRVSNDFWTMTSVAFKKLATISYGSEATVNEWTFDAGRTVCKLGSGTPQ